MTLSPEFERVEVTLFGPVPSPVTALTESLGERDNAIGRKLNDAKSVMEELGLTRGDGVADFSSFEEDAEGDLVKEGEKLEEIDGDPLIDKETGLKERDDTRILCKVSKVGDTLAVWWRETLRDIEPICEADFDVDMEGE